MNDPGRFYRLLPDFAEPAAVESFAVFHGEDVGRIGAFEDGIKPLPYCPGNEDFPPAESRLQVLLVFPQDI